jgi:hypothetical protein
MGKKAKEHRRKVAKRNAILAQKKSGMQKAFDMLIQQQLEKLKADEDMKAVVGDQQLDMSIIEERVVDHAFKFTPNEEESAKINKEFEEQSTEEEK